MSCVRATSFQKQGLGRLGRGAGVSARSSKKAHCQLWSSSPRLLCRGCPSGFCRAVLASVGLRRTASERGGVRGRGACRPGQRACHRTCRPSYEQQTGYQGNKHRRTCVWVGRAPRKSTKELTTHQMAVLPKTTASGASDATCSCRKRLPQTLRSHGCSSHALGGTQPAAPTGSESCLHDRYATRCRGRTQGRAKMAQDNGRLRGSCRLGRSQRACVHFRPAKGLQKPPSRVRLQSNPPTEASPTARTAEPAYLSRARSPERR